MSRTFANVNGTNVGTYHLSDRPDLYEPSRSNAFEFLLDLDGDSQFINYTYNEDQPEGSLLAAGVSAATASADDYFTDASNVVRLSVAESSIPHFDLEVIRIRRGNSEMKFAGTPTFSEGQIKCNDYVGARTKDILLAWQRLAYDVVNDVVELASNYKRTCQLIEYTPDYSSIVRSWTLYGCWVKTLSEGNFSHDSNDKRSIDVTIVFDRAVPTVEKAPAKVE